jgi:hypothetical protein
MKYMTVGTVTVSMQVASVLLEVLVAASQPLVVNHVRPLTGFSPQPSSASRVAVEKVYTASKALLSMAKLRGPHLKVGKSRVGWVYSLE